MQRLVVKWPDDPHCECECTMGILYESVEALNTEFKRLIDARLVEYKKYCSDLEIWGTRKVAAAKLIGHDQASKDRFDIWMTDNPPPVGFDPEFEVVGRKFWFDNFTRSNRSNGEIYAICPVVCTLDAWFESQLSS